MSEPAGSPRRQSAVGHYSSSVSTTTINDNVVVAVATNTLVPLHLHLERGRKKRGEGERRRGRRGKEGFEGFQCLTSAQSYGMQCNQATEGFGIIIHVVIMHSDVSMDGRYRASLS